jgi:hypothetical protein
LYFNNFHKLLGGSKQIPFSILLSIGELVIELLKNFVNAHTLLNFTLLLLNSDSTFINVVFNLVQMINITWFFSHFVGDFSEFHRKLGVSLLGKACNHCNFLLLNFFVLLGVHVADVVADYSKH